MIKAKTPILILLAFLASSIHSENGLDNGVDSLAQVQPNEQQELSFEVN